MIRDQKNLRRWLYRVLPATLPAFYSARRRGLDHGATGNGRYPVAEIQKKYLLGWVGMAGGSFLELDAGDGVTGSHAVWLEEVGWKGVSLEKRESNSSEMHFRHPPTSRASGADRGTQRRAREPVAAMTVRHRDADGFRLRRRWVPRFRCAARRMTKAKSRFLL